MSLSPLAERIYQTLVQQLRLSNPLISYGDLVRTLGSLPPPDANLKANDPRLFKALGEILRACQSSSPPIPALISIVVRRQPDGKLGTPGSGYFVAVFPQVSGETARLQAWRDEVRRVVAFSYPTKLASEPFRGPRESHVAAFSDPNEQASVLVSRPTESKPAPRWVREPTVIAAMIGLIGTVLAVIIPLWISMLRGEPSQPRQAESLVLKIIPRPSELSQPRQAEPNVLRITSQANESSGSLPSGPPGETKTSRVLTLDEILEVLERQRQRATFGAVAAILGREPQSLFVGYVRSSKTAWVVSKSTGLPTGTKKADYPPELLRNERIIESADELHVWLRDHKPRNLDGP